MNKLSVNAKLLEARPKPTPRDMLTPIFRHQRLALAVSSGVFLLALFFAFFWASRYYVSQMQIVVDQDRSDPAITAAPNAAVMSNRGVSQDQINSEIALIKGQDILRSVAQTCGLDTHWTAAELFLPDDPERIRAARIEDAAHHLSKGVKAEAEKISDVITVKYGAFGNPNTPACVLQNIGKLYLEKRLELRRPPGAFNFFAEQTEKYRQQLADVETRLTEFSHTEGIAAPDVLRSDVAQQVAASMGALHQAQQQIAGDEERLDADATQSSKTPDRIKTQQSANAANLLLQQLQGDLLTAKLKRQQLVMKYDPSFPLVREADEEIARTQAAIDDAKQTNYANQTTDLNPTFQFLQEDSARTRLDLATQRANAASIANSIHAMERQMVDLDGKSVKQNALLREEKADEANYLLYLGKREQERTSDALDQKRITDVVIAVPAVPAALPAFNPFVVAFGGLILALLAGTGAAFGADWLDPSFRTPAEVMHTLSLPVLAAVPRQLAGRNVFALLSHQSPPPRRSSGFLPSLYDLEPQGRSGERSARDASTQAPHRGAAPQDGKGGPNV
jgi:uncharacterized protein involved in exopolysaccharide biosynthesis